MEIEEFEKKLKQTKITYLHTGELGIMGFKNGFTYTLRNKNDLKECPCCHQIKPKNEIGEVRITFFKEQKLTIFEAELIYCLFAINKKPIDYGGYHRCQAGKEFIENIKEVSK